MAKRAGAAKKTNKREPEIQELNPGASASGCWVVHRTGSQPLSVYADQLDITENGTLIFFIGGSNGQPQVVVAGDQYLYCTKIR